MIGERRNCDPGLLLSIDLTKCDGEYFISQDAYGHRAQMSDNLWRLTGAMFNGIDDYIDLGAGKPTDLTGDITISAWINPEGWGEGNAGQILRNEVLKFYIDDYLDSIVFMSDGSTVARSATNAIVLDTWQHILVTRPSAGTNTNIYINGVLSGTANQNSGTPAAGTTNTFIGNKEAGVLSFDGQISNLKIWNRKIGAIEESRRMFQEGRKAA